MATSCKMVTDSAIYKSYLDPIESIHPVQLSTNIQNNNNNQNKNVKRINKRTRIDTKCHEPEIVVTTSFYQFTNHKIMIQISNESQKSRIYTQFD